MDSDGLQRDVQFASKKVVDLKCAKRNVEKRGRDEIPCNSLEKIEIKLEHKNKLLKELLSDLLEGS